MTVKQNKKISPMELLIRALIVIIFCASVALTVGLLMDVNQKRREIEELKKEKEALEQALGESESGAKNE